MAKRTGVDATVIRIGFALLALCGGFGVAGYLALWLLVPMDGASTSIAARASSDRRGIVLALCLLPALVATLIVAAELSNSAADFHSLLPMIDQAQCNTDLNPQMTLADTGYAYEAGLCELEERGLAACVALGREDKRQRTFNAKRKPATARMARTLRTPEGRAHYRRRKAISEPVFGWIKQVLGFRSFSLRGFPAASAEWRLMCMAVNLKRMHRLGWAPA